MAGLFKNKTIKAKLAGYEIPNFEEKLTILKSWQEAYQNKSLHKKTESQCEQAFNQSFFIEILGYKSFPTDPYTLDPKGNVETSGQKPDAILGYFSNDKNRVIAAVEIKDVNTSLDKSQRREGSLSPVQQAFKYKTQYKECDFVIATNFFEIRLLKDNQLDFESFTLESLTDSKENYFEFRKFYYLLNAENFVAKSGQTNTLKLLSEIRIEQEEITKDFYRRYKDLRQQLIKNILENNQQARLREQFYPLAVEKAQKIIDRLVFICFCEDLELLPEDKLQEVVFHTEKIGLTIPIWEIMKNFFSAIDHGSEKLGIPNGFNGELFKEDEALNSLKIDDKICKQFIELGKYDFSEDLSVNILGHIFEQSISDLEELKNMTEESQVAEPVKKTSKRKKDGIYYTPDYIVDYIVKNSLGKYLEEQEQVILAKNGVKTDINDVNYHKRMKTAYEEYREVLKKIRVLDPACGSGAFLVKVFDYLYAEHERVNSILADLSKGKADLFASKDYIKSLLQDNIYGVDLNPESVEITKLSLWLKTAAKGEKLVSLKNNIKCGNSLIDDPAIAGERAFKWEEEFPDIMKNGGFDVVVGNPPYVLCQPSNTPKPVLDFFKDSYKSASYKIDLFHLFIEKSILLLKKSGYLGMITPNTYLTNKYIEKLRVFILNNSYIREIVLFDDDVFEDANVDTSIIILSKDQSDDKNKAKIYQMRSSGESKLNNSINVQEWNKDKVFNVASKKQKSYSNCLLFKEIGKSYFGIQAFDRKSSISKEKISENYREMIDGEDVLRYSYCNPHLYFNFIKDNIKSGGDIEIYKQERIAIPQIGKFLKAGLVKSGVVTSNTIYNLYLTNNIFNIKYLLAILNSRFMRSYWLQNFSDNKQLFPKIKGYQIAQLPIPKASLETQESISEKVDLLLNYNLFFQEKLQKSLKLLQQEFQLEKVSTKLEKFYELDFDGFIKALGIKKLDLQKKSELLDFFEKNKRELLDLKLQIEKEDRVIDEMVFDLYGLTEEERKTILDSKF